MTVVRRMARRHLGKPAGADLAGREFRSDLASLIRKPVAHSRVTHSAVAIVQDLFLR